MVCVCACVCMSDCANISWTLAECWKQQQHLWPKVLANRNLMSRYVGTLSAAPTVLHLPGNQQKSQWLGHQWREKGTEDRQAERCSFWADVCSEKNKNEMTSTSGWNEFPERHSHSDFHSLSRGACWVGSDIWSGWLPHISLERCFGHVHLKEPPRQTAESLYLPSSHEMPCAPRGRKGSWEEDVSGRF